MEEFWVCHHCRSLNRASASKCYSCREKYGSRPKEGAPAVKNARVASPPTALPTMADFGAAAVQQPYLARPVALPSAVAAGSAVPGTPARREARGVSNPVSAVKRRIAGFFVLGGVALAVIAAVVTARRSPFFRKFLSKLIGDIPLVKDVMKKNALQRFAGILSSLIKAGMPITESLEITAQTVSNQELREALIRISREGVAKGLTIGEAFRREPFFPLTVVSLVAISERAGHLSEVLQTLSDFYVKEIDASVKTLVSFLEPALLLFIGGIIGLIALAIIIPIYQLTTQF